MPIPERVRRLFAPELEPGEAIRAVANADLWLRYRRLALTDRRLLVVERGGVRRPWGGRRITSVPLACIARFHVTANPVQTTVRLRLDRPATGAAEPARGGRALGFALPTVSRATPAFVAALRRELAGRERVSPAGP